MRFLLLFILSTIHTSAFAEPWNPVCDQIGSAMGDSLYQKDPWQWWRGFNDPREINRTWFLETSSSYSLLQSDPFTLKFAQIPSAVSDNLSKQKDQNASNSNAASNFNLLFSENKINDYAAENLFLKSIANRCLRVTSNRSCTQAAKKLIDLAKMEMLYDNYGRNLIVMMRPLLRKIFTHSDHLLPLADLLQSHANDMAKDQTQNTLLDDLKKIYSNREDAWDFLGVYGTQASALAYFQAFYDGVNKQKILRDEKNQIQGIYGLRTVGEVSITINHEDTLSWRKNQWYSLPSNIQVSCRTGKSYHFWMTAYYARSLVKLGYSVEAAAASAYTLARNFNFFSNTAGRSFWQTLTSSKDSIHNQSLRMTLALDALGAWYGALDPSHASEKASFQTHTEIMNQALTLSQNSQYLGNTSPAPTLNPLNLGKYEPELEKVLAADLIFNLAKPK